MDSSFQPEPHDRASESMGWLGRMRHRVGQFFGHSHNNGDTVRELMDSGSVGIRATKVSLAGLGITALFQAVIVVFSGSVALLSDTLHNVTDALTAIPLWIAFSFGRRRPTRTFTYGYHRAEDLAGLLIVAAIGASAVLVIWESLRRLVEPRLIDYIPWVIAAGVVGALGNELVARYRIRVGRDIGSEALITDGQHARTDALTSLAVVIAAIGAAFGAAWVDPVAGLVVGGAIVWLLTRTARRMWRRLLDGIEPELVDQIETVICGVARVDDVTGLQVRWHGHTLRVTASVCVAPGLSVEAGHDIAHAVEHELHHALPANVVAIIHVEPHGKLEAHEATAHHQPEEPQ